MANHSRHPIKAMDMRVQEICFYNEQLFRLSLQIPEGSGEQVPEVDPGQFAQLQIPSPSGAFLRRPLSVFGATPHGVDFLVQVAGRGTADLSHCRVGDQLNVLLPLGRGFSTPQKWMLSRSSLAPLLVGGGVGIAPLYALSKTLKSAGYSPKLLLGARSATLLPDLEEVGRYSDLLITTDDGSLGTHGLVTSHPIWSEEIDCIYCCGPTPMMKAVARMAMERGIPIEVSLENKMACGVGVCLCCIEPTKAGYQTTCTEGPVFDPHDLEW